MVPHEDRPRQVIQSLPAVLASVAAAFLLPMVLAALADPVRIAVRTMHLVGPSSLSDLIVALGFVYEFVNAAHSQNRYLLEKAWILPRPQNPI